MEIGDILIVKNKIIKDGNLYAIPKYTKVIIWSKCNMNKFYKNNSHIAYGIKTKDTARILTDDEIALNFWTLAEYRKIKIEDLITECI